MNELVLITHMSNDKEIYILPTKDNQRDLIYKTLEKNKSI